MTEKKERCIFIWEDVLCGKNTSGMVMTIAKTREGAINAVIAEMDKCLLEKHLSLGSTAKPVGLLGTEGIDPTNLEDHNRTMCQMIRQELEGKECRMITIEEEFSFIMFGSH